MDYFRESPLLKLDNDCVLHIFSFLNLLDQASLSKSCSRLNEIGTTMYRKIRVDFDETFDCSCSSSTKLLEEQNAFKKFGKYVEHISFTCCNKSRAAFPLLCPNLRSLELHLINNIIPSHLCELPVFSQLESITLSSCDLSDDDVFQILPFCSKLKKLDISYNYKIHRNGFNILKNTIIDLNLDNCFQVESACFINLCKLAKFKKLNISSNFELNESALEQLSKVKSLETLIFSTGYLTNDYRSIVQLSNLKNLYIQNSQIRNNNLNDEFYATLAREKSKSIQKFCLDGVDLNDFIKRVICSFINLKCLCLLYKADDDILARLVNSNINLTHLSIAYSLNVSDTALLNFIEKSKNIRVIDIIFCEQFDSSFVLNLVEILTKLKRSTYLKLFVAQTKVQSSVENESILNGFKYLKLYFDMSYSLPNSF